MVGVVEVQHRARASGGGCAGRDQDGAVVAARASAEDAARGASERADRMGWQRAVAVARGSRRGGGTRRGCGVRVCRRSASAGRTRTWCWRKRRREKLRWEQREDGAAIGAEAIPIPLLVSGRDEAALRAQAGRYADWLSRHPDVDWADCAEHGGVASDAFAARCIGIGARTRRRRRKRCLRWARGGRTQRCRREQARERGRVVFVFPGQGSQWATMGRALLAEFAGVCRDRCGV